MRSLCSSEWIFKQTFSLQRRSAPSAPRWTLRHRQDVELRSNGSRFERFWTLRPRYVHIRCSQLPNPQWATACVRIVEALITERPPLEWVDFIKGPTCQQLLLLHSVTRKKRKMSKKVAQKWFHEKNDRFWHLYKNCLRMLETWAK